MNRLVLCSTIAILCCAGAAFAQGPPPNDTCAGAIEFMCGQTVNVQTNTALANNDYDQLGVCTSFDSSGPDIVYKFVIPNGGTVDLTLQPTYDGSLYLITNCADPAGSCLVGSDECFTPAEHITYTNNTGLTQTTFLIVDGYNLVGGCGGPSGAAALTGTFTCPPTPTGACCATDGTCSVTTQAACTGTWQGPGSDCDPNPCIGPPTGACCRDAQPCAITTRADCDATGGQYFGDGSTCGPPDPCEIIPVEPTTWGRIKNIYGK